MSWSDIGVSESLPTGTVTLLLADVEGSTQLWETRPGEMAAAFARLDRTLSEAVDVYGAARPLEQGEGDSFVLAFSSASDAVASALHLQRAALHPIKLRIGVHTGEVQLRDERNYFGPTINKTARLRDLGHGGQTLLSGVTHEMVSDRLPPDSWLEDLGIYPLRGVARPERVVQLCHPELANEFPALRSTNVVAPHNLPAELTSFVGRADEIKDVRNRLTMSRLVTLTGAGGSGKTRLALQVAGQMVDEFRSGVLFVDLAPITDPEHVASTAARALGLPEHSGPSAVNTLSRFIADRRMLLVLDNCEHLLDASAQLAIALLATCPELTLLATSREPLGVTGEVTWRVPSLTIADEAVELFTDRACRARPDFRADGHSATVMEICRRLDGMPLAIELAAARVRSMSLTEIADSLHDRFHLLTGGARTLMARQQTLRASVDWSHELLSESERVLFRRLAVFVGGFDLDAAYAVAAGGEVDRYELLDQITLLVDKSLVVAEDRAGRTRYRMLETVRQYAVEKLHESGENQTLHTRHCDYYMALVHRLLTRARTDHHEPAGWESSTVAAGSAHSRELADTRSARTAAEIDNLRAAFSWSAETNTDPRVLIRAARGAAWLLDLPLAERLAGAAIQIGAGVEANIVRAHALSFLGRGEAAEAVLVDAESAELTDAEHAGLVFIRATNRLFTLADPAEAKKLIDQASPQIRDHAGGYLDAFLTVYWAAMGKPEAALESSRRIDWAQLHDVAARATGWALTLAAGDTGATTDAIAAAEAAYLVPIRGYFVITEVHVGALLLAGHTAQAEIEVDRFRGRLAQYSSLVFDPIFFAVAGRADLAAGRIQAACTTLERGRRAFAAMGMTSGVEYRCQLALTTALAIAGATDDAMAALLTLDDTRHPSWRYLDYEYAIARAWVAACQDDIEASVETLLAAAESARANGQFAAEVLCLQTAVQFGDYSSAARLRELTTIVEGPRADVAARFADALAAGDAAGMAAASDDFESMGDLVAALDAAAHAAITYDRQKLRESAVEYTKRAESLAERCDAQTYTLRRLRSVDR